MNIIVFVHENAKGNRFNEFSPAVTFQLDAFCVNGKWIQLISELLSSKPRDRVTNE